MLLALKKGSPVNWLKNNSVFVNATIALIITLNALYEVVGPKTTMAIIVWLIAIGLYQNSPSKEIK